MTYRDPIAEAWGCLNGAPLPASLEPQQPRPKQTHRGRPPVLSRTARHEGVTNWTPGRLIAMRERYAYFRNRGELHILATQLGVTVPALQARAKKEGLTNRRVKP